MKRLFPIVLSLVLVLSLAGTVWASGEKEGGGAAQEEGEQAVTITFSDWHLAEPHWEKALNEAMSTFESENPNINVEMETVSYGEKETKYTTEIQANRGPDVFHLHGYSVKTFIEKGLAKNLEPFLEGEREQVLDPNYDVTLEVMRQDGEYYALPGDYMSMVLFYNKELFREAGLDPNQPPETWSEFLSFAQQLTRDTNNDGQVDTWGFGTIGAISPGFELRFTPVMYSHGARYLNDERTCSALNTDAAKDAFSFFTGLVSEHGVVPPGVTSQNPGTVRQQMSNERVAMILGSGWTPAIVKSNNPDLNWDEILEAAPMPVRDGYEGQVTTTAWISAWLMNPHISGRKAEASWKLMKFVTSEEMEQKWFDDTSVLSSRRDVSEEYQPLLDDKYAGVMADQLSHAQFVPQIKEWPQIIEAINTAAQEAMTGSKSPNEALSDAHRQINEVLSVYRDSGQTCPAF